MYILYYIQWHVFTCKHCIHVSTQRHILSGGKFTKSNFFDFDFIPTYIFMLSWINFNLRFKVEILKHIPGIIHKRIIAFWFVWICLNTVFKRKNARSLFRTINSLQSFFERKSRKQKQITYLGTYFWFWNSYSNCYQYVPIVLRVRYVHYLDGYLQ